jgi:hypothetical protein
MKNTIKNIAIVIAIAVVGLAIAVNLNGILGVIVTLLTTVVETVAIYKLLQRHYSNFTVYEFTLDFYKAEFKYRYEFYTSAVSFITVLAYLFIR